MFDVTSLVRDRIESGKECHGVMLKFEQEDFAAGAHTGYAFVSREGLGERSGRRPRLLLLGPMKRE